MNTDSFESSGSVGVGSLGGGESRWQMGGTRDFRGVQRPQGCPLWGVTRVEVRESRAPSSSSRAPGKWYHSTLLEKERRAGWVVVPGSGRVREWGRTPGGGGGGCFQGPWNLCEVGCSAMAPTVSSRGTLAPSSHSHHTLPTNPSASVKALKADMRRPPWAPSPWSRRKGARSWL